MYIVLDPSEKDSLRIGILTDEEITWERFEGSNRLWFSHIIDYLGDRADDLAGIAVIVGVGGFTGTRLLTIIANMFCFVRGVPALTVSQDELASAFAVCSALREATPGVYISARYSGEPHIG